MRLLIIDCSNSKLAVAISVAAGQLKPKPEMVSTMAINIPKFNVPEFKNMLMHLAADTIVLIPGEETVTDPRWNQLLKETTRHIEVISGRVLFVSSVEVLGDAILRTESAVELPFSDYGTFLYTSEVMLSEATPRCYIMRFPYSADSVRVKQWCTTKLQPTDNEVFTLALPNEMAKVIINRLQTGWFGKYHVTPGDSLVLAAVVGNRDDWNHAVKVPDHSLLSKYAWELTPTRIIWSKLAW